MRFVSADSETARIRPGLIAPPLVCVSYAERIAGVIQTGLLNHVDSVEHMRALLEDPNVTLVFHNGSYDLAVLAAEAPYLIPLIFAALAANRIADTQIREQLIMIRRGDMTFQNVKVAAAENDDEDGDSDEDAEDDTGESAGWKRIKKRYTLDALSLHYLRRALDKADDGWRLRYAELRDVPVEQWPERASAYAIGDSVATLEIFECQAPNEDGLTPELHRYVSPDERMQVCAAFALHLCAVWGVRTDADALDTLETKLNAIQKGLGAKLLHAGLLRYKKEKGVTKLARTMKAIRQLVVSECRARSMPVPLTKKGLELAVKNEPIDLDKYTSTSRDTLEAVASFLYPEDVGLDDRPSWLAGDEVKTKAGPIPGLTFEAFAAVAKQKAAAALEPLVAFANTQKILGTYCKPMALGVVTAMNSRPNVLVESGRTSWGAMSLDLGIEGLKKFKIGANLQNFPRFPGVRDCIMARPGFVLLSVDYDSLELRTLAQAQLHLVGRSTLASRYQRDPNYDPHSSFAARMLGITYEEAMRRKGAGDKAFKKARQAAKAATFGFPGGLGIPKFMLYAKKGYGVELTRPEAERLKAIWLEENPEMVAYFAIISDAVESGGTHGATFTLPSSGRKRGGCGYSDGANYFFQGMAADGAKMALFAVSSECYADPSSVLFGSRPVAFIHDEILLEVPEAVAHAVALRVVEIMEREMMRVTPNVPSRASPALSRHWIKAAEAAYNDDKELICWEDRDLYGKKKAA